MTHTVRTFLRRPGADRRLLVHALVLYVAIAALLRLIAHRRLTRWLDAVYRRAPAPVNAVAVEIARVAWAVRTVAARVHIGPSCLTEALTAQYLLRRAGHAAALRIGVARSGGGVARSSASAPIAAHAWLEHAGRIVVGGDAAPAYQILQAPSPMRGER
ncbi:MAG: lasso peptide biosynthesis B2 protein [Acidobacteriia bacterium]|nr:lasso peptide biosynthesis B2 protein [Terriglobia bacterium]